jgi:hypothetical protein
VYRRRPKQAEDLQPKIRVETLAHEYKLKPYVDDVAELEGRARLKAALDARCIA